jgi:hypothetical protein
MVRGREPKHAPPRVTPFQPGGTKTFTPLLCPGYLCEGVTSVCQLLDIMQDKSAGHPGALMLATLDDAGQAFYTSGHTIDANELDPIPDDEEDDGADGVPLPDFATRRDRLLQSAGAVTLDQLDNRLWWGGEARPSFLALQDNPDAILDRDEIYIQAVPVTHAWEMIAAFPNGYFRDDFSPMENLVLARHVEETFGYALFGIGASYLGFRRTAQLSPERLDALTAFIISLHAESNDPELPGKIRMTLEATDLLFLAYVDR